MAEVAWGGHGDSMNGVTNPKGAAVAPRFPMTHQQLLS